MINVGQSLGLGILMLGGAWSLASPANAQYIQYKYESDLKREDPGAALTRNLRTLSDSPRSLMALLGAGQASLELGDTASALTFFGRAEEIAPRDTRVKAGMGACFSLMEQPALALRYFAEAGPLKADTRAYYGHRGLAHDLVGNNAQAQLDYRAALRDRENWTVRERLALSQAIAGDQAGALQTIEPQLRRSDRAAWRVRAFILALGGDAAGATEAARAVVPASAAQLQPFFARLPQLTPAQRAAAVHFGHMPPDAGPAYARYTAPASVTPSRAASGRTPAETARTPPPVQPTPRPQARSTIPSQASRRPTGFDLARGGSLAERRAATRAARAQAEAQARAEAERQARPSPAPVTPAAIPPPPTRQAPPAPAASQPVPTRADPTPRPFRLAENRTTPIPVQSAAIAPSAAAPEAAPEPAPAARRTAAVPPPPTAPAPKPVPQTPVPFGPPTAPIEQAPSRFADIASLLKTLPDPPETPVTSAAAAKAPVASDAKTPAAAKAAPAAPKEPSRIWVQVAGGANRDALPREFTRLREKAPSLFKGRSPWTTPLKATNRLLVGPFGTEKEAQSFVNDLTEAGLSGFSWTSEEGQAVARLASG